MQQDNAPKQIDICMANEEKKIQDVEMGKSIPDLNPSEMLWRDLKIAVHKWMPSNIKELML